MSHRWISTFITLSNSKISKGTPSNWILPDLARNLDSASSLVTKYVREALANCKDQSIAESSRDFEGTSLRVGAASLLSCHKTTSFIDIVLHGGWEAKGISRLFIYIEGILYPISCAGRALSGWRDSHCSVYQPFCCF